MALTAYKEGQVESPDPTGAGGLAMNNNFKALFDRPVFRVGSGAPSNGTGNDGDSYLNELTNDIYTRASGTYSIVANLDQLGSSTKTANFTAAYHNIYFCDTTGGVINCQLPALAAGKWFIIVDAATSFSTNNLVLKRVASENIELGAADYNLVGKRGIYIIFNNGTDWFVQATNMLTSDLNANNLKIYNVGKLGVGTGSSINGTVEIAAATTGPELRLTNLTSTNYSRVTKANTSNKTARYDKVNKAGAAYGIILDAAAGGASSVNCCRCNSSASLQLTNGITLSMWYKPTGNSSEDAGILMSKGYYLGDYGFGFTTVGGGHDQITIYVGTHAQAINITALTLNTWYHFAFTFDGTTGKLYINGTLQGTTLSFSGSAPTSTAKFYVGGTNAEIGGNDRFVLAGHIADTRIYNAPLVAGDITTLAAGGNPTTPPVTEWRFTENTGTTAADSSGSNTLTLATISPTVWTTDIPSSNPGNPGNTLVEAVVWSSEDGIGGNEEGVFHFGNTAGRLVLDYGTISYCTFQAGGVEVVQLTPTGWLTWQGTKQSIPYTATVSLDPTTGTLFVLGSITGALTINATSGGKAGQKISILLPNDASSGRVVTFGTNFKSSGTLTGTTSKTASITFESDGTNWYEIARTTGM